MMNVVPAFAVFLQAAILATIAFGQTPPEPPRSELTVTQLIEAMQQGSIESRCQAVEALSHRGAEARPAVGVLRKMLHDPEPDVRAMVSLTLGSLRLEPQETIPALAAALDDGANCFAGPVSQVVGISLGQYGKPAVPAALAALNGPSIEARYGAVIALHEIGPDAVDAVPSLIRLTRDDDDKLRRRAIAVLQQIGPGAKAAVPALIEALSHKDFHTQYWACRALGAMKADSAPAVPKLIERLGNGVASVRRNAAAALGHIGPAIGPEGRDALVTALSDFSQPVKEQVVIALGRLKPLSISAVPAIEAALADEKHRLAARSEAARTLWLLRRDPELPRRILLEELQDLREPWTAARVLGEIGPELGAISEVIEVLDSPVAELRSYAAEALGEMGQAASEAKPALQRLAQGDKDEDVRHAAEAALIRIDNHVSASGASGT